MKVKICGLTNQEDAELAVAYGADALGFILEPASPRYMREKLDNEIFLSRLPIYISKVGVFGVLADLPHGFNLVQYVLGDSSDLRLPSVRVVRVDPSDKDEEILANLQGLDYALIEPFSKDKFGGTGKVADWNRLGQILAEAESKIILAGGLTPENVSDAIAKVRPYAVDVSSGVEESPGKKDRFKLRDFIEAAKSV